jgi:hypothetical protein
VAVQVRRCMIIFLKQDGGFGIVFGLRLILQLREDKREEERERKSGRLLGG